MILAVEGIQDSRRLTQQVDVRRHPRQRPCSNFVYARKVLLRDRV